MAHVWVGLVAMRAQNRAMRGSPFAAVLGIVQPVVFLTMTAASPAQLSPASGSRLVIGVGLTALWGSTVWAAGGILSTERAQGTLARSLTGLRSPSVILLGKCLGATMRITVLIAVSTLTTAAILGIRVPIHRPVWMMVGVVLAVLSAMALGVLLSCLFLVTRHATAWSALFMYPVFVVGGMMIPLEFIPQELRWTATVISLRWAAEFLSTAASGTPSWSALALLSGQTCGYLVVGLIVFRRLLQRARREGTLDIV